MMSHTFQRGLPVGDDHGVATGHVERQRGSTHQKVRDERAEPCGTVYHQYTQA